MNMAKKNVVLKSGSENSSASHVSSVRLTQEMRNLILSKMMKHAFGDRTAILDKAFSLLGQDVYNDVYPKSLQAKMKALPDGFLPTSSHMHVSFGGRIANVSFGCSLRVSAALEYNLTKIYSAIDGLSVRYFELAKQRNVLDEESYKAEAAARAALNSCNTTRSLLAVWPEAEPFLKEYLAPPVRALTLSIPDLNKQLRLL